MKRLDNKIAIVTGAAMGIGKAIALGFAKEGAKIVVADINAEKGKETANLISKKGKALFIKADVSNEKDVKKLIHITMKSFGRIDIVVNNAGVYYPRSIEKLDEKTWDKTIDINLKGSFLCTKYSMPFLKKTGGTVINIASSLGLVPETESSVYCASKAGLIMLTKVAALENAQYKIRINCICPGPIDTPLLRNLLTKNQLKEYSETQTLMKKLGSPEDVAKIALFLASDDSSYVTGAAYTVDGGESIN